MRWVWLLASILCEVAATPGLRASRGLRERRWVIPTGLGYATAFFFLGLAPDSGMPLGVAYGLWTAIGIVLIALMARVIWNDPLTQRMLAGMGFVIVGVLLVELG